MNKTLIALAVGAAMFSTSAMAVDKIVNASADAPKAVGPYSQAILAGNTLYMAGQLPLTVDGKLVDSNITDATRQVMNNLGAVLAANGMTMNNVVLSNVFMKDLNEFGDFNKAYGEYFTDGKTPARVTVQAARIPKDARIEISMIAVK